MPSHRNTDKPDKPLEAKEIRFHIGQALSRKQGVEDSLEVAFRATSKNLARI